MIKMVQCVSDQTPCNSVRIPPWFFVKKKHGFGGRAHFRVQCSHTSHMGIEKRIYSSIKGKYNSTPPVKNMFLKKDGFIFSRSLGLQHHQTASPPLAQLFGDLASSELVFQLHQPPRFSHHPSPSPATNHPKLARLFVREISLERLKWNGKAKRGSYKSKQSVSWVRKSFHIDMSFNSQRPWENV